MAVASVNRGNLGNGDNGPCADGTFIPVGSNDAVCDFRVGFVGDEQTRVDMQLRGIVDVQGVVVDAAGVPMSNTTVSLYRPTGYPAYNRTTNTNLQGGFVFNDVPVDRVQIAELLVARGLISAKNKAA